MLKRTCITAFAVLSFALLVAVSPALAQDEEADKGACFTLELNGTCGNGGGPSGSITCVDGSSGPTVFHFVPNVYKCKEALPGEGGQESCALNGSVMEKYVFYGCPSGSYGPLGIELPAQTCPSAKLTGDECKGESDG